MLLAASGRKSAHMPGHKGQAPFGPPDLYALDTTELPLTDDLYTPEGGLLAAEELYARSAGAGCTLMLHNGSTEGIHVMLQLWAREGDTVLLPRNAHHSAVQACVLGGLRPVWMPVTQRTDGFCYVAEQTVLAAIAAHPEAKALLLTRPDYFGTCLPLERIIPAAHARGLRVVVDEAHGAHYPWMELPGSAGRFGADAWTQSVHKTLPGLTGSAVLHLRCPEDRPEALRILRREQTSSPSFLLMLSIDDAREWMALHGRERLAAVREAADALRAQLPALGYRDAHRLWADTGLCFDPTRLVIDAPQGGAALAASLAELGCDVEMYDEHRAVCILTAMDTPEGVDSIGTLLKRIPACQKAENKNPDLPDPALPRAVMTPRQAVMGPCREVPLREAAGRIAAQAAGLYPPGVPLVMPGEVISRATAEALLAAPPRCRFGTEGEMLRCADV